MATKRNLSGTFGWCNDGHHAQCKREVRPFYFEGKKLIYRDEVTLCGCTTRSCACFKARNKKPVEDTKPL